MTSPPARDLEPPAIRAPRSAGAAGASAWVGLCALLLAGALVGWAMPAASLDWQPDLAAAQPWRWWTAAFVHLSALHLVANALGTLVVAWLGWSAQLPLRVTLAWGLAWPATHLALGPLAPGLAHYGGLSGVLHAGVAAAAVHLVASPRPPGFGLADARRRRTIGAAIGAVLAIKLVLEAPWGTPARAVEGWDIPVAPIAHSTGAVAAALITLAFEWLARRAWPSPPVARPRDLP